MVFFGQNKYCPKLSVVVQSKTMPFDDLTPGDWVVFDSLQSNCGSVPCICSLRYVQCQLFGIKLTLVDNVSCLWHKIEHKDKTYLAKQYI
jgi:hypothetical protein